ncbi:uncharacterized protein N7482_004119 [Penicillium canariense]|uniref:Calcineurin binding protein n=1 Tax=Penicillium canariense TaxID=189055 RepID=A0A9W9I615_9EURO|nr:uncharacterized protein N7482_004119 [Penicillium canariense]KAJ5168525.1 hypothetical protein N7482_004119 [Penicillium canariense]
MADSASPPRSLPASPSFQITRSERSSPRPSLSIDLSNIPPLSQPTPPSNTLLITELHDLILFQPSSLEAIRNQITVVARLNSFSPLPSFRRIICSFHSDDDAVAVRKMLEGTRLLNRNVRPRIYFGEPTPILTEEEARRKQLLEAPQLDKLFFISPPPSPPHGWQMRNEDPPNKEVHAGDLASALAMLKTNPPEVMSVDPATPVSVTSDTRTGSWPLAGSQQRSRSSTIIYNPEDHGHSPNLPAVMVEDMTLAVDEDEDVDMDGELSPIEMSVQKMPPKTARPPVELMG